MQEMMLEIIKMAQAAPSAITAMVKVFLLALRTASSCESDPELLPSFESAFLISEALMPLVGNNGGPSGSIAQTVSSPFGTTPLTKKFEMIFWVQVDF